MNLFVIVTNMQAQTYIFRIICAIILLYNFDVEIMPKEK